MDTDQHNPENAQIPAHLLQRVNALLRDGRTDYAHVAGMTPEEMEGLYARALELLRHGLTDDALHAFSALTVLRPSESRYYRGIGLAAQHKKRYGLAQMAYAAALALNPNDGIAQALRAECNIYTSTPEMAKAMLEQVVARGAQTPHEVVYIERAKQLLKKVG